MFKIISSRNPFGEAIKAFTALIKERIEPFNSTGLLDTACKNMYKHTVAEI